MRNELKELLKKKCERLECDLKNVELEVIFGMYTNNEEEFKLMRGDHILLKEIASNLNDKFTKEGPDAFSKQYEPPKRYKINKINTDIFSFGTFYGKKSRQRLKITLSKDEMVTQLFTILKPFFESFTKLKPVCEISEDIIKLVDLGKMCFRADVICVFCPQNDCKTESLLKRFAVQHDRGQWNKSNLRKHIRIQHCQIESLQNVKTSTPCKNADNKNGDMLNLDSLNHNRTALDFNGGTPIQFVNPPHSNASKISPSFVLDKSELNEIMSMPIIIGNNSQSPNDQVGLSNVSLNNTLYNLFSAQNILLMQANLTNNETKKSMLMKFDGQNHKVDVIKIEDDGNCMFTTIVHQLKFVKCNTSEHTALAIRLRATVVEHITKNFSKFKRLIQERIGCSDEKTNESCSTFLERLKIDSNTWGGTETLLAVMELYSVNIVILNENGPVYFVNGFNQNYNKLIFMAYRICGNKHNHNHYDTIFTLSEDLMYKFTSHFSKKMQQTKCDSKIDIF